MGRDILVLQNEPIQKVLMMTCQVNWSNLWCAVCVSVTVVQLWNNYLHFDPLSYRCFICVYFYALLYFVVSHRLFHSFLLHIWIISDRISCNKVFRRGNETTHEWTLPSSCLLLWSNTPPSFVHASASSSCMFSALSPFW